MAQECETFPHFYPRSPCGERRRWTSSKTSRQIFLSTLSLRRATEYWVGGYGTANNFYPRSPCGERLPRRGISACHHDFYPRSPCGERQLCNLLLTYIGHFYPRSPCGERPSKTPQNWRKPHISIHALLAESDLTLICPVIAEMTISIHALLAESDSSTQCRL